jgi:hypothetical protein
MECWVILLWAFLQNVQNGKKDVRVITSDYSENHVEIIFSALMELFPWQTCMAKYPTKYNRFPCLVQMNTLCRIFILTAWSGTCPWRLYKTISLCRGETAEVADERQKSSVDGIQLSIYMLSRPRRQYAKTWFS